MTPPVGLSSPAAATPDRVQLLLDAFVAVAAEPDEQAMLGQVVDLARLATQARYGAAVLTDATGITHLAHAGMTSRQVAALPHPPLGQGVLGEVLAAARPIRLDRLQDSPASTGFPLGHVPMAAFLGVPLLSEDLLVGALYLTKPPGHGRFTDADEALIAALGRQAGQAAVALRTSRDATDLAERLAIAESLKSSALAGLSADLEPSVAIARILQAARSNLGMQLSVVSRIADGVQHFEHLSGPGEDFGLREGVAAAADGGYCHYMLRGELPMVVPDTGADPLAAELRATADGVSAYAGVPLIMPDGRHYGSLCTLDRNSRPLGHHDRAFLAVLADLVADQLARLQAQQTQCAAKEAALRPCLAPGGLTIVVQPIVDLQTGQIVGVEALSRFPAWSGGGPDTVFAAAKEAGLGQDLELTAVAAALQLLPELPDGVYLSVNADPRTVVDPRLLPLIASARSDRVLLELTEHAAVDSYPQLRSTLELLRAIGVRIAVDDTGSGFAGLQHILAIGPDVIKLDIGLVRGIDTDPARRALARALISFAGDLGAGLVAEGIETHAELDTLQALGMRHGQGYRLARPAPLVDHDLASPCWTGTDRRDPRSAGGHLRGGRSSGGAAVLPLDLAT